MGKWAPPEVIASARNGSTSGVEELIAVIWPACFRLAMMVTGDRGLAEDAAQEACVIVHRKVRGLRSSEAFDLWLYRIVMHESGRVCRRRGQVAEPADDVALLDDTLTLDVWRALATLSTELREVIVLFYFVDLKGEEVATALRVTHGTVRTRLTRARERLRLLLGDYDFRPQDATREFQHNAV